MKGFLLALLVITFASLAAAQPFPLSPGTTVIAPQSPSQLSSSSRRPALSVGR